MTKTIIGVDTLGQQAYEREYSERFKAFSELREFVQKHSKTEINAQELYDSPRDYFLQLMEEQHRSEFPSSLKLLKILDLLEIPVHILDTLIERFNSFDIELDLNSEKPPKKDFNIYAENAKQENVFKLLSHLCNTIDKLSNEQLTIQYGAIISGVVGGVDYDFSSGKLHPRISYIQSITE